MNQNSISLPKNPTLADYQTYIRQMVAARGFDKETVPEVFTLLVEEIGELAKAIRKANGQKMDQNSRQHDAEEEAADVLFLLINLCNLHNIDLEVAFRAKEDRNKQRNWS